MKAVAWMAGASLASCLAATAVVGGRAGAEILSGMVAPLLAVSASWLAVERTFRRHPDRVTSLMTLAFGAKFVFFGVYVAIVLGVLALRPVPFLGSFISYFVGLYATEALLLRRLFAGEREAR